jgi:mono/diheme cytochrome c family protein
VNGDAIAALALGLACLAGCDNMDNQPKQRAYSPLVGPAAIPSDTVEFQVQPVEVPAVTLALLQRGQERYRIDCTPCHSELGDGHGMIVQRGFPPPRSFQSDPLRSASPQHLYDVITDGYGVMYSFADRVQPADRWAIVAYIYALERSQHAAFADMTADQRNRLP